MILLRVPDEEKEQKKCKIKRLKMLPLLLQTKNKHTFQENKKAHQIDGLFQFIDFMNLLLCRG